MLNLSQKREKIWQIKNSLILCAKIFLILHITDYYMSTNVSSYTTTDFLIITDGSGINRPHSTISIILNCITDLFHLFLCSRRLARLKYLKKHNNLITLENSCRHCTRSLKMVLCLMFVCALLS